MGVNSPKETIELIQNAATGKSQTPLGRTALLGTLAGAYIAMGGLLSVIVGFGFPSITAANPGLQRLLSGCCFPIGLILVVIVGAELFTGNNATLIPGAVSRRYPWAYVAKNWTVVWLSNFAGALLFTYLMAYLTGAATAEPWKSATIGIAQAKVSMPWLTVLVKGIGANWLVCLAVWAGSSVNDGAGKIMALWFPVMCFVAIGFEHSIANMFFIPMGMLNGADVSIGQMLTANLIPATIGNILGGALFVATPYIIAYGRRK